MKISYFSLFLGLPWSSLLFFCYSSVYQGRTCTIPGSSAGKSPLGTGRARSAPPRGSSCAPRALPRRSSRRRQAAEPRRAAESSRRAGRRAEPSRVTEHLFRSAHSPQPQPTEQLGEGRRRKTPCRAAHSRRGLPSSCFLRRKNGGFCRAFRIVRAGKHQLHGAVHARAWLRGHYSKTCT